MCLKTYVEMHFPNYHNCTHMILTIHNILVNNCNSKLMIYPGTRENTYMSDHNVILSGQSFIKAQTGSQRIECLIYQQTQFLGC